MAASGLEALTSAALVHIPNAALQTMRADHPDLADAMAFDAAVDMAVQMQWSTNVGRKCSRARLAHFLSEMAARCARTSVRMGSSFELPLTQFHLADALAITPVHVNRTLMALRAERIVEIRNRTVHVLDWPALTRLGEFDPFYLVNRTSEIARTCDDWPCRRRA